MFSQTVEYALRATVHLAEHSGTPQKTSDIAASTKVPAAYLSKILQGLHRQKIVHLQRGIGGGVSLAVPPEKLTILDIVNAVDPIVRINSCPLGLQSHTKLLCSLHTKMDDTLRRTEQELGSSTLSDLISRNHPNRGLCGS
jgi:Rrf2 family transcriptional regulator, nitric oxide-sensitive transcriptional repressor